MKHSMVLDVDFDDLDGLIESIKSFYTATIETQQRVERQAEETGEAVPSMPGDSFKMTGMLSDKTDNSMGYLKIEHHFQGVVH